MTHVDPDKTSAECPEGCGRRRQGSHVLCSECWDRLPAELRKSTWGLYLRQRGSRAHVQRVRECVEAARENLKPRSEP